MNPLDPRTVQRIVATTCDIGGTFERSGRELEYLLKCAGWPDPPEYDGSPRVPWLLETLTDRQATSSAVESLIRRICDPIEYDDGESSAELIRQEVNRILRPEGLAVVIEHGKPLLGRLDEQRDKVTFSAPGDLEARLQQMIKDPDAVSWLVARAEETRICEQHGAYVFALVGIGSFVEHLLQCVLTEHDPDIRERGLALDNGKTISLDRASLELLIRTAHAKGWIQLDARDFLDKVRDYRNFVHLRRQRQSELSPDADTVMMCWGPVRAVLNDLETTFGTCRSN